MAEGMARRSNDDCTRPRAAIARDNWYDAPIGDLTSARLRIADIRGPRGAPTPVARGKRFPNKSKSLRRGGRSAA